MIDKNYASALNSRVFYKNSRLLGGVARRNGIFVGYSPEGMLSTLFNYERLLREGRYEEVRRIEEEENHPKVWLNGVISGLILDRRGLAEKLVKEFKDRGYSDVWLKKKNERKLKI